MPPTKTSSDMPGIARFFAALVACSLIALGAYVAIIVRPFDWKIAILVVVILGLAADLLWGAICARWPIAAGLWITP